MVTGIVSDLCTRCGGVYQLGHDERCSFARHYYTPRHDTLKQLVARTLGHLPATQVREEPHSDEGARRNDILVSGAGPGNSGPVQYDIKVYTLTSGHTRTLNSTPPEGTSTQSHCRALCLSYLETIERAAVKRAPVTPERFAPLVISTGGLVGNSFLVELAKWKRSLPPGTLTRLAATVSSSLLRMRTLAFQFGTVGPDQAFRDQQQARNQQTTWAAAAAPPVHNRLVGQGPSTAEDSTDSQANTAGSTTPLQEDASGDNAAG